MYRRRLLLISLCSKIINSPRDSQTLQSVRQSCSCTTATWQYRFARFPSCGIFTPTRTTSVNQRVETTGWRCQWTPPKQKLRVAGQGLGNTRARRTNTAKREPKMPMHHGHGRVHVCAVSSGTCTLAPSGFVWLCQPKKHDLALKKSKKSMFQGQRSKKIPVQYLFFNNFFLLCISSIVLHPSVSLFGVNSTTKYSVSPAFQPSTDSIPVSQSVYLYYKNTLIE